MFFHSDDWSKCVEMSMMHDSVEACTAFGGKCLAKGDTEAALNAFKKAYIMAKKKGVKDSIRKTMFNLGAVHVAARKFSEGIEILKSAAAVEASSNEAGPSEFDIFYNIGLACELKGSEIEAIQYFERTAKMYAMSQRNSLTAGEVKCRLGRLYSRQEEYGKAAKSYGIASLAYEAAGEKEQQAICLCHQASLLEVDKRPEDATRIAAQCVVLCQKIPEADYIGKLYNELGLLYAKCQRPAQAEACFKLAIPLLGNDSKSMAVVQQNLGAVYNCLGDYQMSIKHHEAAADLYIRSGSRNGQGQCFSNLAYAYAQLGDIESASEYYLHALQAAKDSKDRHDRWQALEGLGTVAFRLKRLDRAVFYFQKALSTLHETEEEAQSRIVGKLTQVLELKLTMKKKADAQKHDSGKSEQEFNEPLKRTLSPTYTMSKNQGLSKQTHQLLSSGRASKAHVPGEDSSQVAAMTTPENLRKSSASQSSRKEDQNAEKHADQEADLAIKDDQLVKSYQQKLESKEKESASDSSTDNDDSDDDTTTETEQPPAPSFLMRAAPNAPASSSKLLFGTYLEPMFGDVRTLEKSRTTTSWKEDPDYVTIPIQNDSPEKPPLPPRLYRQPAISREDAANSEKLFESDVKLPQKPVSAHKQKSRACSVM